MVQVGLKDQGKISPTSLLLLRPGFESLLVEENTGLEGTCNLSTPLRYLNAIQSSPGVLRLLHCDFTLLLAQSISLFSGEEKRRRVEEVITMLWVITSVDNSTFDRSKIMDISGTQRFFEANESILMGWIKTSNKIPRIHDILHCLCLAQLAEPKIVGPLWRASQADANPHLMEALQAFDDLITSDEKPTALGTKTSTQHYTLVDLLCRDLEMGQPEMFKKSFTGHHLKQIEALDDPCLQLLAKSVGVLRNEPVDLTFVESEGPLKESWARIAKYLMEHYKDTNSVAILQMQASLWDLFHSKDEHYNRALKDPKVLVRRIY
jgi:hypothetical protein